jgi:release factor glutamine methyltransferase
MLVEFDGVSLEALPGVVMTPRGTSVALVDQVVGFVGSEPAVVADVGTGSGALAIAIALRAPRATVWATDVDRQAVALARANALRAGVSDRVQVRLGDLLEPVGEPLDVIAANLPYLPWHESPLHPDLANEPSAAVFADGDGLGAYRRLLDAATQRLVPGGLLVVQLRGRMLAASAEELSLLEPAFAERAA